MNLENDPFEIAERRAAGDKDPHPECQEGEMWMINSGMPEALAWATARVGNTAYAGDGQDVTDFGVSPVFVKIQEVLGAGPGVNRQGYKELVITKSVPYADAEKWQLVEVDS